MRALRPQAGHSAWQGFARHTSSRPDPPPTNASARGVRFAGSPIAIARCSNASSQNSSVQNARYSRRARLPRRSVGSAHTNRSRACGRKTRSPCLNASSPAVEGLVIIEAHDRKQTGIFSAHEDDIVSACVVLREGPNSNMTSSKEKWTDPVLLTRSERIVTIGLSLRKPPRHGDRQRRGDGIGDQ